MVYSIYVVCFVGRLLFGVDCCASCDLTVVLEITIETGMAVMVIVVCCYGSCCLLVDSLWLCECVWVALGDCTCKVVATTINKIAVC